MNAKRIMHLLALLMVAALMVVNRPMTHAEPFYQEQDCAIDLMLVLDGSGSISSRDFETMQQWVTELVARFTLGEDAAKVGIVQFSNFAQLEGRLSGDVNQVQADINGMYKIDGGTDIHSGLIEAHDELQARGRADAPQIIIVLTDGEDSSNAPYFADQIRGESNSQITILGVAVGEIRLSEIIAVAGGEFNVIQVPDFDGLRQILSILHDYSCAVATEGTTSGSTALVFPTSVPVDSSAAVVQQQPTVAPNTQIQPTPAAANGNSPTAQPQPTVAPNTPTPVPTQVALAPLPSNLEDTQIAFSSNRDGDTEIFLMDADGGNLHQVTNNNFTDDKPDISPNGRQIAWESNAAGTFDIWVVNSDGSDAHPITDNSSQDWGASWSPDGSQLAFHSVRGDVSGIWIMDSDGGNAHQITRTVNGADRSASWSPDGTKLVYYSDRSEGRELYIIDLASGEETRLTEDEVYDGEPDWFGSQITFASTRASTDTRSDICFMNEDGSDTHCLTQFIGTENDPSWSPDGSFVVFESGMSGNYDIWIARPDGSELRQITADGSRDWSADWGVKP